MTVPVLTLVFATLSGNPWRFNDYYVYWLAGQIIAAGGNPYDLSILASFAARDGRPMTLAGPYSYLPPFALSMIPFSAVPFEASAWIFSAVSLAVFGLAVTVLLTRGSLSQQLPLRTRTWVALLAGGYPPIGGSLMLGQANLMVFGLLASGFLLLVTRTERPGVSRLRIAGFALGLAAVIKLVPSLLVLTLVLARQSAAASALLIAAFSTLGLSLLAAPLAVQGSATLGVLFEPDGYWTNQSVNGFVSRVLSDTDRTRALTPNLFPTDAAVGVCTAILALLTAAVLWRSRAVLRTPAGLGLGLALALVAGSAGAPKNSFWNHAPALLAVWVVLSLDRPVVRSGSGIQIERGLLATWLAGAFIQTAIGHLPGALDGPFDGLRTVLASSAFYGLLALWLLVCWELERQRQAAGPGPTLPPRPARPALRPRRS